MIMRDCITAKDRTTFHETEQQHCYGCERSLSELMAEYNHIKKRYNNYADLMTDPEEVLEQPEIVFMNAGHWYCHSDCLRDCY